LPINIDPKDQINIGSIEPELDGDKLAISIYGNDGDNSIATDEGGNLSVKFEKTQLTEVIELLKSIKFYLEIIVEFKLETLEEN